MRAKARRPNGNGAHPVRHMFSLFARRAAFATGSAWAFGVAIAFVLAWIVAGPAFGFSTEWQLFINTLTTISTFLMVFLIQHQTNTDALAMQLKLDELIGAVKGASNVLIDAENLDEEELLRLRDKFQQLSERAAKSRPKQPVSVEDALSRDERREMRRAKHEPARGGSL